MCVSGGGGGNTGGWGQAGVRRGWAVTDASLWLLLPCAAAAVTEALAGTQEGWKLLQQHVVAELTMRELDMQVRQAHKHTQA